MKLLEKRREKRRIRDEEERRVRRARQADAEAGARMRARESFAGMTDEQLARYVDYKRDQRVRYYRDSEVMNLCHVEMVEGITEQERRAAAVPPYEESPIDNEATNG